MIVADASLLIALMNPLDEHHRDALRIVAALDDETVLVHPVNAAEALVGPARRGKVERAREALADAGVHVIDVDGGAAARLAVLRSDTSLSMPDCCALDAALVVDAPLATYDRRLAKAAVGLGIALAA